MRCPSIATLQSKFRCSAKRAKQLRTELNSTSDFNGSLRVAEAFVGASPPHGRDHADGSGQTIIKKRTKNGVSKCNTLVLIWTGTSMESRKISEVKVTTYQDWIKNHGPAIP